MDDLRLQIGGRIRRLRRARRDSAGKPLSITALARDASLSADYLNKLELGRYTPSADTLVALARALDVRLDDLVPALDQTTERGEALDELCAIVSTYSPEEIRYIIEVVRVVMGPRG